MELDNIKENKKLIINLKTLARFKTAPNLSQIERNSLSEELSIYMKKADWFTIGIMAPSEIKAIKVLRDLEQKFNWKKIKIISSNLNSNPVFLKANQESELAYIRNEFGLGEGVLITCQFNNVEKLSNTHGPFPLDFFFNY